jgi:protein O-mannosyl-transferase
MEPIQPTPQAATRRHALWICLGLALCTLLVYWPVTRFEFTGYDDTDYVTQNAYVQAGFTAQSLAWVWHSEVARNWHPVTMLSHMLDCQLHGMKAGWHHLTNLLLHLANTLLLFLLLKRLTGALWRSALVAALFALHPLHVESVAWVAERKDVLSTCFALLSLGAYARYAASAQGRGSRVEGKKAKTQPVRHESGQASAGRPALWYALALLLFALGLMSKPMLVTLPFVLLLLDYWPLQRFDLSTHHAPRPTVRLLLEKTPFLALAAASSVITFLVQQQGGAVQSTSMLPMAARVENALVSYVRYLGKMVWPDHLAALYLRSGGWSAWQVGLAAVFLVAVSAAVIWQWRRRPYLAVGWFWYVGTLVPVIGVVQVGMQSMADRYTYIPLIGIFLILAWGGWELVERWRVPRIGPALGAAVVLGMCMVLTHVQVGYWKDGETVLNRMITATKGNYMAHFNLGNLYDRRGEAAKAIEHYKRALKYEPNYADAHNNLGGVLLKQRRFDEALAHYTAAVRINTDFVHFFNLANALADAGRFPEARTAYGQCLQLNPNYGPAHHNLGLVAQTQGKPAEAIAEFRAALALDPAYESACFNLANLLAEAGQGEEAITNYLAAERLNPKRAESYNGLGICYAMQGKMGEAERQFQQALQLNPHYANAESNLANALGAQNRLKEAIPHYQKALEMNPQDFQTHFNLAVSLLHHQQPTEAKAHLLEALRLHPDYPEAQKALAAIEGAEKK